MEHRDYMGEAAAATRLTRSGQQNQSLSFFKFIAAILVVFIHARFPGDVGTAVQAVSRCGVGGFFAISGFFSLGADRKKLEKRAKSIFKLLLAGIGIELLCGCISVEFLGAYPEAFQGSIVAYLRSMVPTLQEWMVWLLVNSVSFGEHLWYLSALLFCYGILWVYTGFFGEEKVTYKMLYLAGACLLCVYLVLGPMSAVIGLPYHRMLLRNGLLLGLPMFSLGLFLRQYWQQIWENYGCSAQKLLGLILLGILLSLLECFGNSSECDLFVGSLIIVAAVILLAARYPVVSRKPWVDTLASVCGKLSAGIYLVHIAIKEIWVLSLGEAELLTGPLAWLYPLIVVLVSGLLSGIWIALMGAGKKLFVKKG